MIVHRNKCSGVKFDINLRLCHFHTDINKYYVIVFRLYQSIRGQSFLDYFPSLTHSTNWVHLLCTFYF